METHADQLTENNEPPAPPGYLTERQVAAFLDKEVSTLRQWAARRKGPPRTNAGRRILYPEKKFFQWLETRTVDFRELRGAGCA